MRAFVKTALDGARRGSRAQYYELLDAIDGLEEADVARDKTMMLEALAEHVSSLDVRVHENLLQKVLRANPWRCRDDVVSLVIVFCVNLVVTHAGSLLQTVLDVLVESFTPPAGYPVEALQEDMDMGRRGGGAGAGAGASSPTPPPARAALEGTGGAGSRPASETTAAIVGAVESILTLVPLAVSVLRPTLLQRLPHKSSHRATQCQYLRAAFRLVETPSGAPLRDVLLQSVVAHMLELDVDIKWEDIRAERPNDGDDGGDDDGDDDSDDDADDDDDDDADGKDGAGIFELEDIEKTIEEQLVRQAAAWERGYGMHGGGGMSARGDPGGANYGGYYPDNNHSRPRERG
jgi:RNA polymerase I-specific transcription initiation factor RRN3